jgi:hypothetical protein
MGNGQPMNRFRELGMGLSRRAVFAAGLVVEE